MIFCVKIKTIRVGTADIIKEAITAPRAEKYCICINHIINVHISCFGHRMTANIKFKFTPLNAPSAITTKIGLDKDIAICQNL